MLQESMQTDAWMDAWMDDGWMMAAHKQVMYNAKLDKWVII